MRKLIVALSLFALLAAIHPAAAAIAVDITQGTPQPLPIAIPDFVPAGNDGGNAARIAQVVRADLDRSGIFRTIDPKAYVDHITDINVAPNFANWRVINAQGLVTGEVAMQPDGRLRVAFRLWDIFGQSQMDGQQFFTQPENWRRVAHMVSDAIYERVTGEKGYFDTRIVFISETGPATARVKRLAVMDEDGANPIFLTKGDYMVLTPRFNPTAQMIAYMSYIGGKPRVYLFDLETGKQERLGDFPNMTFSPRFSPDGNKVALTLENNGNSDIWVMDLRNRSVVQLTHDPAIDTAPCFSPDGKQIAFESDRGGSQQVYVMNADGSNQHRVSFGAGNNGTPVWSPRGDLIAFTKQRGSSFDIGVMRTDGSAERMISTGYHDEGPTWAPNGRVLMFTREGRNVAPAQIWSVDVFGHNERRVETPGSASDPAWSPLIQ